MNPALYSLPLDCFRVVASFLCAFDIGRLWITGNSRLHRIIASGGVENFDLRFVLPSPRQLAWPSLISYLPRIKLFHIKHSQTRTWDGKLETVPKSLETLQFSIPSVEKLLAPYTSTTSPSVNALKDLFPRLKSFVVHTAKPGKWSFASDCFLPATLTKLKFAVYVRVLTQELIESLPSLTYLSGSFSDKQWKGSLKFAPTLSKLLLGHCFDYSILPSIIRLQSLVRLHLNFRGSHSKMREEQETLFQQLPSSLHKLFLAVSTPMPSSFYHHLPTGLVSLEVSERSGLLDLDELIKTDWPPNLNSLLLWGRFPGEGEPGHGRIIQLLKSLPSSLTQLRLSGFKEYSSEESRALPKKLIDDSGIYWMPNLDLTAIPPTMTRLSLPSTLLLTDETLKLLPTCLVILNAQLGLCTFRSIPTLLMMERLTNVTILPTSMFEMESSSSTSLDPSATASSEDSGSLPSFVEPVRMLSLRRTMYRSAAEVCRALIPAKFESASYSHRMPRPLILDFDYGDITSSSMSIHETSTEDPIIDCEEALKWLDMLERPGLNESGHLQRGPRRLYITYSPSNNRDRDNIPVLHATTFPETLRELDITGFNLDPDIIYMLPRHGTLISIEMADFDKPLTDQHLAALPRKVGELSLLGCSTSVTSKGLRSLPPTLNSASLPLCPLAEREFKAMESHEIRSCLPQFLSSVGFYNREGHRKDSPWISLV